ncbi:MAG TPA: SDR family NAD(P)-dependent oxidoreductase [Jatrophihabitans sp.]|jgi:NAD(P)-dependent dehydrogenase (short-subunit alcohol dehydrogenase family)
MLAALDPSALLEGKVTVVTGAGGAIGSATAKLFAAHGAQVVVADIDPELTAACVAAIEQGGGTAIGVVTDVRDRSHVDALASTVLDRYGRVDVVVNNVGDWVRHVGAFVNGDDEFWDELYKVNLWNVFAVTKAFLPSMTHHRSGSIVNVASVEALRGYPEDPVYAAFKAGVVHFTRSLAVQVGYQGVRVNAIGPDVTESLQVPYSQWIPPEQQKLWPLWVPAGRMGVGEDQARVILFLASDLAGFVTGHTIPTDGGTGAAGGWFRSNSRLDREWTNRPLNP